MFWSTANFNELVKQLMPTFLRKVRHMALVQSFVKPIQTLHDETLYQMQHDGRTIYLEKVLNEWFEVVGYSHQNHETTKQVYIEDLAQEPKLYVHQDYEASVVFLEDDPDTIDDVFVDLENEGFGAYSYTIFIPDTFVFEEVKVRAFVDQYRYFGKKYNIQTYTL